MIHFDEMSPDEQAEFRYLVAERYGIMRPNGGAPTWEQIQLAEKEAHEAIERQRKYRNPFDIPLPKP